MITQVLREHLVKELGAGLGCEQSPPEILWRELYLVVSWDLCSKIFISVPAAVTGTTFNLADPDSLDRIVAKVRELTKATV